MINTNANEFIRWMSGDVSNQIRKISKVIGLKGRDAAAREKKTLVLVLIYSTIPVAIKNRQ